MGKVANGVVAGCILTAAGLAANVGFYPTFEQAKDFEFLRGRYTRNVASEKFHKYPEYIKSVEYVDSSAINLFRREYMVPEHSIMFTYSGEQEASEIGSGKIVSTIFVFPEAFTGENIREEGDFKSLLLNHEITHAEHYYEGFPSIPKIKKGEGVDLKVFEITNELSALRHEIANFPKGMSMWRKEITLTAYMEYYAGLWKLQNSQLQEGSVKGLKDHFFEGWMPHSNSFVEEKGSYFIISPVTQETLQLPDSVAEKIRQRH